MGVSDYVTPYLHNFTKITFILSLTCIILRPLNILRLLRYSVDFNALGYTHL